MKEQSELFQIRLFKLDKVDLSSLPPEDQAFFSGNLDESIACHLRKEQETVSSKFSLLHNTLDTRDDRYIRMVGDTQEYYEMKKDFGRIYMGDELVMLINIRRQDQGKKEIIGLDM